MKLYAQFRDCFNNIESAPVATQHNTAANLPLNPSIKWLIMTAVASL